VLPLWCAAADPAPLLRRLLGRLLHVLLVKSLDSCLDPRHPVLLDEQVCVVQVGDDELVLVRLLAVQPQQVLLGGDVAVRACVGRMCGRKRRWQQQSGMCEGVVCACGTRQQRTSSARRRQRTRGARGCGDACAPPVQLLPEPLITTLPSEECSSCGGDHGLHQAAGVVWLRRRLSVAKVIQTAWHLRTVSCAQPITRQGCDGTRQHVVHQSSGVRASLLVWAHS
jgi:hypothetical protein